MAKFLIWIVLGIIAVVIFINVLNWAREDAQPFVMSPGDLERLETYGLSRLSEVIVTLKDSRFHHSGCSEISGDTLWITLEQALQENTQPCSVCIKKDEENR